MTRFETERDMSVSVLWLAVYLLSQLHNVQSAKCTGEVTANLEVTGAFTKVNGTNFLVSQRFMIYLTNLSFRSGRLTIDQIDVESS